MTTFIQACSSGNLEEVKKQLSDESQRSKYFKMKDSLGHGPLSVAANSGHTEVVKYLLEVGAPVNQSSSDGMTALHRASDTSRHEIVKLLITNGKADVNLKSSSDKTPLHFAAWHPGNDAFLCTQYLVEGGADVDAMDSAGWSPLHMGVGVNNVPVVEYLIKKGASIDYKTTVGETVLHRAARSNFISMTRVLIEGGATIEVNDNNGFRPVDLSTNHAIKSALRMMAVKRRKEIAENPIPPAKQSIPNVPAPPSNKAVEAATSGAEAKP